MSDTLARRPQTHYVRLIVETGREDRLEFLSYKSRFTALETVNRWNAIANGRFVYWLAP